MGSIVGGFLVPHDPLMFVAPEAPAPAVREQVWGWYRECANRLARMEPTSVIIVGADHYMLFGTTCLPSFLIATGDVEGPIDVLPGLRRGPVQTSEALASHIATEGLETGFDWAVARAFTIDHAVSIPNQLMVDPIREAGKSVGTIPVYLASGVDPYIRLPRVAQLGRHIRNAVESFDGDERVVVIGSGGISHWVGTRDMGRVNPEFDREILGYAERGDLDELCSLSDDYILTHGGNGAMEIRHFACAMAAVGGTGEVIGYSAVPEWVTGLGFVELKAGARA